MSLRRRNSFGQRVAEMAIRYKLDASDVEIIYDETVTNRGREKVESDLEAFYSELPFKGLGKQKLTRDDLCVFLKKHHINLSPKHLQEVFDTIGVSHTGFLEKSDMLHFIQTADSKNNGMHGDFIDMMNRLVLQLRRRDTIAELENTYGGKFTRKVSRLPHIELNHRFLKKSEVAIVGAPFGDGQHIGGCELTPEWYRTKSTLFHDCVDLGWKVCDRGDLQFNDLWEEVTDKKEDPSDVNIRGCHKTGLCSQILSQEVEEQIKEGRFIVTLGGDHAIAFGSIAGIMRSRPSTGIVWVDAHGDINIPECSPSGSLHGMPLGAIMGISDFKHYPGWEWLDCQVTPGNIVFIGLRDLDEMEIEILNGIGAHVFDRHRVQKLGIGQVMARTMEILNPHGTRPIHLSFDIDGIDPAFAPSTGTCAKGGLTWGESVYICEFLANTGCLCSMDLAEINTEILRGATAGSHDSVITNSNVKEMTLSELELMTLQNNPEMTIELGKTLVLAALGKRPF